MINLLHLNNVKCFEALSLPCNYLTVLTGFNGAGKSTTLQAILLLAQTLRGDKDSTEISLNGSLARLGTPGEVLRETAQTKALLLGVEDEYTTLKWHLQAENRREDRSVRIHEIYLETAAGERLYTQPSRLAYLLPPDEDVPETAKQLVTRLHETIFLSAVRLSTTAEVFPIPTKTTLIQADVGLQGEFAPWWLLQADLDNIDPQRCHPSTPSRVPRVQMNAWLNDLFPGAEVNVEAIPQTSLIRLELRIGHTQWRRPANIGYGLTYAFPILVAGLLAKPAQIVIIDSPEAHLHPLGQSHMGRFLAKMAAAGVQIMLETHSDHVLNGIRLAVRDGLIQPEQAIVHFFTHHPETLVVSAYLDAQGNLSDWPEGFFDQAEKDLAQLAGWV